jgi:hypothetical protein
MQLVTQFKKLKNRGKDVRIPSTEELFLQKSFKKAFEKGSSAFDLVRTISTAAELQAFYSSRVLIRTDERSRERVLHELEEKANDEENVQKVFYLKYAFSQYDKYYASAKMSAENLSAEDIIYFLEYVLRRLEVRGVSADGKIYPQDILHSQYDHLIYTLAESFSFIRDNSIPFCGSTSLRKRPVCQAFITAFAHCVSIHSQIIDVLHSSYVPREPSTLIFKYDLGKDGARVLSVARFFLERVPANWQRIETYRDLNYGHAYRNEQNATKLEQVLRNSKVLRTNSDGSIARFNFTRVDEYEIELQFHKVAQLLEPIYGDPSTKFEYREDTYEVGDLINVAKAIFTVGVRLEKEASRNLGTGAAKLVKAIGMRSLARALGLEGRQRVLLDLFSFDFSEIKSSDPRYRPLIKRDGICYLICSQIKVQCYEKVIDKILSGSDINVLLGGTKKKGHVFEEQLKDLLTNAGYVWADIKADDAKDIPETDGVFLLSENDVVVYEAKCSIKPEERDDAYTFVENHLTKAAAQLYRRMVFLRERVQEAEMRLPFNVKNKEITPLIITNHSYFTGAGPISIGDTQIHIIDYELFSQIVRDKRIPVWNCESGESTYTRKERLLGSTNDLKSALINPVQFLAGMARTTVQVTETGIIFEISKTPLTRD